MTVHQFPDTDIADRARAMAQEAFYQPNYGRAELPRPSLRIRVLDWLRLFWWRWSCFIVEGLTRVFRCAKWRGRSAGTAETT